MTFCPTDDEIRDAVGSLSRGGSVSANADERDRLGWIIAAVRYVNRLGPDWEAEGGSERYARVAAVMGATG